jgi:aryl-alcohol dehydrogenase-like predicted oxidoreductase
MQKSTVYVTGIPVVISWKWHAPDQIEWYLDESTSPEHARKLLENFLRAMRTDYIEYMLNDEHQARIYEEDQRAAVAAEDFNPF